MNTDLLQAILDDLKSEKLFANIENTIAAHIGGIVSLSEVAEKLDMTTKLTQMVFQGGTVNEVIQRLEILLAAQPLEEFTVFCQQADGRGTIWISGVMAMSATHAARVGRETCAEDWEYETTDVHVLGVAKAEGKIQILEWDDLCD